MIHMKEYGNQQKIKKNPQEAVKDFHNEFTTKAKPWESPDLQNWICTCIPSQGFSVAGYINPLAMLACTKWNSCLGKGVMLWIHPYGKPYSIQTSMISFALSLYFIATLCSWSSLGLSFYIIVNLLLFYPFML